MSGNDYIKYVTQEITAYIDTPRDEKKLKRSQKKSLSPIFSNRWFGILPFAFKFFKKKSK